MKTSTRNSWKKKKKPRTPSQSFSPLGESKKKDRIVGYSFAPDLEYGDSRLSERKIKDSNQILRQSIKFQDSKQPALW